MADQDPPVEGQDNPEDRPEWLPPNFDSPEALAKSYTEAQRKITELSTQNKGLEESIGNLSAQFEQFTTQQNQPDPQAVYGQWNELYEQDPAYATTQLAQQVAAASAKQVLEQYVQQQQQQPGIDPAQFSAFVADQTLTAKYGDEWTHYRAKVGEEVQSNPLYNNNQVWTNPDSATQTLEHAFKSVKADDMLAGNTVAQQQMADTRQMKLNAQSAVGASGRPDAPSDDAQEWAKIMVARPKGYWE